jgi:hypothetical protein
MTGVRTFLLLIFAWIAPLSVISFHVVRSDWIDAEMTVLKFPEKPNIDLSAQDVAMGTLRSLQLVDFPTEGAGIQRILPFLTWECRHSISGTENDFGKRAVLSPILQAIMGANQIELGEATMIPGTVTRGEICSMPVKIQQASVLSFSHSSGMLRSGLVQPETTIILRLERQRRPPLQGCWLVRDFVREYAKGGQGWSRDEGV